MIIIYPLTFDPFTLTLRSKGSHCLKISRWSCFKCHHFLIRNVCIDSWKHPNSSHSSFSQSIRALSRFLPLCPSAAACSPPFAHSFSLPFRFSLLSFPLPTFPLSPTLTKGSQRAAAQTAVHVCLLINGINHLALRELFILKMNYLKLQHNAVSFLPLPHYCSGRHKTHHWPYLLCTPLRLPPSYPTVFLSVHPALTTSTPPSCAYEQKKGNQRILN